MIDEVVRRTDDKLLWDLLGVVELTYHPALAIAVILGVDAVVSPVPSVLFDPLSITFSGRGLPITTVVAAVVVVDLVGDIIGVYATGWFVTGGDGDE